MRQLPPATATELMGEVPASVAFIILFKDLDGDGLWGPDDTVVGAAEAHMLGYAGGDVAAHTAARVARGGAGQLASVG